jgi:hypothetical protein
MYTATAARVILNFLAKPVGEPRETAHGHPHCEVLAFKVGCVDVLAVGIASGNLALASSAFAHD